MVRYITASDAADRGDVRHIPAYLFPYSYRSRAGQHNRSQVSVTTVTKGTKVTVRIVAIALASPRYLRVTSRSLMVRLRAIKSTYEGRPGEGGRGGNRLMLVLVQDFAPVPEATRGAPPPDRGSGRLSGGSA